MDMQNNKDYFEIYLDRFPKVPSLVIVRSTEAKLFPYRYVKYPVLDLCCGDGFFAKTIGLEKNYTIGCDIDKRALESARAEGCYKEVILSDARYLNEIQSESFETVISNCALEHVQGIENAISSINRILKQGGHLIMSVPSDMIYRWFPSFWNRDKKIRIYNKRQNHINIMSIHEWIELLSNGGFEVEEYFYLFSKEQYTRVIFFDALPEILPKPLFLFYELVLRVLPSKVTKFLWRKILKDIYENSKRLEKDGGELIIVSRKIKKIFG